MNRPFIAVMSLIPSDAHALGDFFEAVGADEHSRTFFHPHPLTREYARELCDNVEQLKDRYYVLFVGDLIAGYAMLRGWDEGYSVPSFGVCVHPTLQNAGVGHVMLTHAIAESRRAGSPKMRLTVYKENTRAIHLYKKYGFEFSEKDAQNLLGVLDLTQKDLVPARPIAEEKLTAWAREQAASPLRVGFWMVYETGSTQGTVLPNEGIGVYACNLIRSVVSSPEKPSVVVLALPQHEETLATALGEHSNLSIISPNSPPASEKSGTTPIAPPPLRRRLLSAGLHAGKWILGCLRGMVHWGQHLHHHYCSYRQPERIARGLKRRIGKIPAIFVLLLASPFLLAAWLLEHYTVATFRILHQLGRFSLRMARYFKPTTSTLPSLDDAPTYNLIHHAARQANCDIWCVVTLYSNCPPDLPSVFLLYDLVTAHHPEAFCRSEMIRSYRRAVINARRATTVGTMTACVRDVDICKLVGVDPDKVRLVRPAVVSGLLPDKSENLHECADPLPKVDPILEKISPRIQAYKSREFLFYPTVFRLHKNIIALLTAFSMMIKQSPREDLVLVLTNPGSDETRAKYSHACELLGILDRVHMLGDISRDEVAFLYRHASATVIPSIYEGIGLQLFEALEYGCPVACSDIPVFQEHCREFDGAIPFFDPVNPADIAEKVESLLADRQRVRQNQQTRFRQLSCRNWEVVAKEWIRCFRDAATLAKRTPREVESQPTNRPSRVFLFLPVATWGGVWEATKDLVQALVRINNKRKLLDLTFAVSEHQKDVNSLKDVIPVETLLLDNIHANELPSYGVDVLPFVHSDPRATSPGFSLVSNLSALKADAWFSMADRFEFPLFPERPYGVVVWDVIQLHAPETFDPGFFPVYQRGILPTVRNAQFVVTTNPVTQMDVRGEIGDSSSEVRVIPVSCEPEKRFSEVHPDSVDLPKDQFILNVNNGAPHKGIVPMLQGYARLKKALGSKTPLLVVCGINTEKYSPAYKSTVDHPAWAHARKMVTQLGLIEGQDVVFLGHVSDGEMLDLFQSCRMVVNSAKYDNGSFNLIEGHYFGKPVLSTRYPAAEWLYERFDIPVRYFDIDDYDGMAKAMRQVFFQAPPTDEELDQVRTRLRSPELQLEQYALRYYEMLLELAQNKGQASTDQSAPLRRVAA